MRELSKEEASSIININKKFADGIKDCKDVEGLSKYIVSGLSEWIDNLYETLGSEEERPEIGVNISVDPDNIGNEVDIELVSTNKAGQNLIDIIDLVKGDSNLLKYLFKGTI